MLIDDVDARAPFAAAAYVDISPLCCRYMIDILMIFNEARR